MRRLGIALMMSGVVLAGCLIATTHALSIEDKLILAALFLFWTGAALVIARADW